MRQHMLNIKSDQETEILSFDCIEMGWPGKD